jgi:SPP1 family predicted phage head-tail adaptor
MSLRALIQNELLELKRPTKSADGVGGFTESWVSQGFFYGRLNPISSEERIIADKKWAEATHNIYAYPMDVRENDRIIWGSWTFDVIGILNPSEGFHYLKIIAREVD